jgi:hypothetical protein
MPAVNSSPASVPETIHLPDESRFEREAPPAAVVDQSAIRKLLPVDAPTDDCDCDCVGED